MSDAVDHTPAPVRYVSMPGSPYTGSTLLGMLMANHPACTSIGAATGLTAKVDLDTYQCSCGLPFTECCFWHRIKHAQIVTLKGIGHLAMEEDPSTVSVARDFLDGNDIRLPDGARRCECASALSHALVTAPELVPPQVKRELAPIIGKYMK